MALLSAVAAQAATALENGRLYRQLRTKADELERMRQFSENILESLNDGLAVARPQRPRRPLEPPDGGAVRRAPRGRGRPAARRAVRRPDRRDDSGLLGASARRRRLLPRSRCRRGTIRRAGCWSTSARRRCAIRPPTIVGTIVIVEDISTRVQLEEQLQISEKMASIGLLAAGVAHEVNTPLTGISSFTQMLLQQAAAGRSDDEGAREDRAADVPRREDRQRPAESRAAGAGRQRPVRHQRRHQRRAVAARAPVPHRQHPGAEGAGRRRARRAGHRAQAAAGVPEPVPQRARRDAEGRLADDRDAAGSERRGRRGRRHRVGHPAGAACRASTIRSSRPRRSARAPGSGCRSPTASSRSTAARITCDSQVGQGTRFSIRLPLAEAVRKAL